MIFHKRTHDKNKKGFTLMELVVTTTIMGTLAAFAIPTYMENANKAKGAKTADNISLAAGAILQAYSRVAGEGNASAGSAIATFNTAADSLKAGEVLIWYGSSTTPDSVSVDDIFPTGAPTSPFNGDYYDLTVSQAGDADWQLTSDGLLTLRINTRPTMTIYDPAYPNDISKTIKP